MQAMLAEQPLIVSLMLGIVAAGLIYGWLQTGKRAAAIAALVMALLIPLVWVIAANVQTDREEIEALIYEIAEAVEQNDHPRALKVIADPQTKAQAQQELKRWEFQLARVNRIRSIDVIEGTFPPEADVEMSVKVDVSQRRGSLRNVRVPRRLLLKFKKIDDEWLVADYRHMPMTGRPDQYSTGPNQTIPQQ